jgi:hypothetical protein
MRRRAALTIALLLAARAGYAADPREQQLAQALFDEARQLMEQKRFSEACPKLAESQRLDPGGGTLLNLAVCHEKEGRLATAQTEYGEALSVAVRDGRKDREAIAKERLAAIEGKVPRIAIVVPPAADVEGLEVKLDGLVLRRAAWGVATPADPGLHTVEATAPGRKAWSAQAPVPNAPEKKTIEVPVLEPLGALPPPAVQYVPAPAPAPAPSGSPVAPPVFTWEASHPNAMFYVVLGVGVVGAAVGTVTGVLALNANSTAKDGCNAERHFCKDQTSLDAASSARTFAWASTGAFVVGAVAGIALFFIPMRVRGKPAPQVGLAPGGAFVRGTF